MKIPMIQARMRVGSNGPPLHQFKTDQILQYWLKNHQRLAEKTWVKAMPDSVVVKRIQEEAEKNYTSTMYL